jgi:hypothetical protein
MIVSTGEESYVDDDGISIHYSVLGAITSLRTYKNIAYLLTSFPLGLAYFLFLIIGLSLGIGLSFILIGIPLLIFVLGMSLALIDFERTLANTLLDTEIPSSYGIVSPNAGIIARAKAMVTSLSTAKGLAFLLIKFPLGIVSFVVAVLTVAVTFGLFFAPLYYQSENITVDALGIGQVNTIGEAFLVSGVGLLSGIVTLPLTSLLAGIWRGLARLMLGGGANGSEYVGRTITVEKQKREFEDDYPEVVHVAKPIGRPVIDDDTSRNSDLDSPGSQGLPQARPAAAASEEQRDI